MSLYLEYFKIHIKRTLEYKASFIMTFISNFIVFFGYYFTIICLFDKFSNIKGYTMYEVLLTFSIVQLGFSFCEIFFRGLDTFDNMMVAGEFDKILLRPRGILHQLLCEEVHFGRSSRLIQALLILIIAIINLNIEWSILKIFALIFMIISSILIYISLLVITASYCFVTIKGLEFRNVLLYGSREISQYPIGIFKKGFVFIFTYLIPFGFVNYYPLLYVLGRKDYNILVFSPLIVVIYLLFSIFVFYKLLKKYKSSGS